MPYRAMFATIVMVAFALLALGMWIRVVDPVLVSAEKADATATLPVTHTANSSAPRTAVMPESIKVRWVMQGTLLLAFVLICLLLMVGFGATFREWARFGSRRTVRTPQKTAYVDAWKIAGERLQLNDPDDD